MFGVCQLHEASAIRAEFERVTDLGMATDEPPGCFNRGQQWHEYIVAAAISGGYATRGKPSPINYCRDCTPAYKKAMLAEGKCAHPETVFIREHGQGDTVGVCVTSKRTSHVWEQAIMGMSGSVVVMPPQEVVGRMLEEISETNPVGEQPKRRGRPPNKSRGHE
jgi:hypothetical protein